jgi:RHS repeat-associated protein
VVAGGYGNYGGIKEMVNYYPFGKVWNLDYYPAAQTRYLFNGKEKQIVGDINYMDYGNRMYDDFLGRWFVQDLLQEKYPGLSPYAYCGNNPINRIDPNGMDWYSYIHRDDNGEEHIEYKYFDHALSDKKMKEGGYTHLGKTYSEGDTYYSLFGSKKDLRTQEGQIYQKVDNAIIEYANWHINDLKNRNDQWAETFPMRYIDMSIKTNQKKLEIEYEGSMWGIYNNYSGKDALKGQINSEYFFNGVKDNGEEVPFQFNGGTIAPVYVGPKGFYFVIENSSRMGNRSPHIIDLSYTPAQAIKMREKYQKLFFGK